jgi:hypothetical protein
VQAHADILRLRKERVHSTMLVEVLALLIFMSMAFAFVLRDDAAKLNPWKQKHDQVLAQLRAAERENGALKRQVTELERANRQLLRSYTGTISANDALVIDRAQWRELIQKLANAEAIVAAQQRDNSSLRARLAGRGGSDLPNCTVSPTAFIVALELQEGGLRATRVWPESATSAARQVPGLSELADGRTRSTAVFKSLSTRIKAWGRAQPTPCTFRVLATLRHGSITTYRAQQAAIGNAFYATYR